LFFSYFQRVFSPFAVAISNVQSDWTRHGRCWSSSTREAHSVCNDGSTISNLLLSLMPLPQEALHGDQSDQSVTWKSSWWIVLADLSRGGRTSSTHLAHRINLLFRSRRTWWSHALLFLNERHERTAFATSAIEEPPHTHFQTDPARVRALGPFAPLGGLTKGIVARGQDHVVLTLFLSPEITNVRSHLKTLSSIQVSYIEKSMLLKGLCWKKKFLMRIERIGKSWR